MALPAIPKQNVFPQVLETELLALLVADSLDIGGFELVNIKRSCLNVLVGDGQDFLDLRHDPQVRIVLVLQRRSELSRAFARLGMAGLPIAGFIAASSVPVHLAGRDAFAHVRIKCHLGREDFGLFGLGRDADVRVVTLDIERDRLRIRCGLIRELDGEGFGLPDTRASGS